MRGCEVVGGTRRQRIGLALHRGGPDDAAVAGRGQQSRTSPCRTRGNALRITRRTMLGAGTRNPLRSFSLKLPRALLSSPGSTRRSSKRGPGVLDCPVKPGNDTDRIGVARKRRAAEGTRRWMTEDKNHARRDRRADPKGLAFRRPRNRAVRCPRAWTVRNRPSVLFGPAALQPLRNRTAQTRTQRRGVRRLVRRRRWRGRARRRPCRGARLSQRLRSCRRREGMGRSRLHALCGGQRSQQGVRRTRRASAAHAAGFGPGHRLHARRGGGFRHRRRRRPNTAR